MKFKSWFRSNSKLIYVKKKNISTFHFWLHNSTARLSNVLKHSRSFGTQWNLLCRKYKINEFYFGYKHKIYELVIFNQTTKIYTHEEKYFRSISNECKTSEFQGLFIISAQNVSAFGSLQTPFFLSSRIPHLESGLVVSPLLFQKPQKNGCGVIWSKHQWCHWMSIWECEKRS